MFFTTPIIRRVDPTECHFCKSQLVKKASDTKFIFKCGTVRGGPLGDELFQSRKCKKMVEKYIDAPLHVNVYIKEMVDKIIELKEKIECLEDSLNHHKKKD